jgi:hypothetical protein
MSESENEFFDESENEFFKGYVEYVEKSKAHPWRQVTKQLKAAISRDIFWRWDVASWAYAHDPLNYERAEAEALKTLAPDEQGLLHDVAYGTLVKEFFKSEDYQKFKLEVFEAYMRLVEQALQEEEATT